MPLVALALLCGLAATAPATARASGPDLSVKLDVKPDPGVVGGSLSEIATVTNDGDEIATDVALVYLLVQDVTIVDSPGCIQLGPIVVRCAIGTLAPGASASRTVVFGNLKPPTLEVTVSATLADGVVDPTRENNSVAASTAINQRPDLRLDLATSPAPAEVGDDITVTASIGNGGAGPAPHAVLQLVIPDGVVVASMPDGCSLTGTRVSCALGTINIGAATMRSIALRGFPEGSYTLLGSLASDVDDLATGNDRTQASFTVSPKPAAAMSTARVAASKLVTGLPPAGHCLAKRSLSLMLRPQRPMLSAVNVFISGRRVRRVVGPGLVKRVTLTGVPAHGFTLRVTSELTDGNRLVGERRLKACPRKHRKKHRK